MFLCAINPHQKKAKISKGKECWEVLRGPWAHKQSSHKQRMQALTAASSSDESDNEPQAAQLPPQPLSLPTKFGVRSHVRRGTG